MITHLFAGVAVADYEAAAAWYERLFGRPPEMLPQEGEAVWRVADAGWVYVVADADRARGNGLLTILVDDIEAHVAELAARGLDPGEIVTRPGVRRCEITDPEGNRITFGQPNSSE